MVSASKPTASHQSLTPALFKGEGEKAVSVFRLAVIGFTTHFFIFSFFHFFILILVPVPVIVPVANVGLCRHHVGFV